MEQPSPAAAPCFRCFADGTATYFALKGELPWVVEQLATLGVIPRDAAPRALEHLRQSASADPHLFPLCQACSDELHVPTGEVGAEGGNVPCMKQPLKGAETSWEDALGSLRDRQQPQEPRPVPYSGEQFPDRRDAALAATKAAGCTCEPDITFDGDMARIKHDYWCAVLRRKDTN